MTQPNLPADKAAVPWPAEFLSWQSDTDTLAALRAFAPELHVCDAEALAGFQAFGIADVAIQQAMALMRTEGYFQLDSLPWDLPIERMARLVEQLQQLGMPTALCFLYDEFWLVFAKLRGLLTGLLGSSYKLLPDFWAWCVGGGQGDEAGWTPHRDKLGGVALFPDGAPKSVTVWVPLSDATPLNGCMYLVPADRDRGYPAGKPDFDLPDIRALPAAAGSAFFWNQAVLHWGGRRSARHAVPARISIAFEFQSGKVEPFNRPLLDPLHLPLLTLRMQLIAKQVLQYQHAYPLRPEARAWAEATIARQD